MRHRGFTLIELLVVLAIAAVLLMLVVPLGAHQRERAEMNRSVEDMVSALRATRSRAIRYDRPEAFSVDVRLAQYRGAGTPAAVGLPSGTHLTLVTTEEEKRSNTLGSIRFFPDGSSTGGSITVEKGAVRYDLQIDWLTGGVSTRGTGS